ncbi:endo-beta-N-acetylglucosaminidase [Fodinicola feengrottensis]|uniref:endo-beta-N-acetylglucosaminidase n=1 Tax=Fodinicola feengrottensis TaxID=435914 RepID=UPI002441F07C|nr:hypothetical protein [Fodinicola feengrottensis]
MGAAEPAAAGSIAPVWPGTAGGFPGFEVDTSAKIADLLAYVPEKDPDAKFWRSRVPLAARIPALTQAQAQPALDPRTRATNLSQVYMPLTSDQARYNPSDGTDYAVTTQHADKAAEFQYVRYGTSVNVYVPRFSQYQDIFSGWPASNESITCLPNPAYVDTAHRNGVIALGAIGNPYMSAGDPHGFLAQDESGRFVVGDKLVDLAAFFGFDGYFLNFEESVPVAQVAKIMAMFGAMKARASQLGLKTFHLQWYDSLGVDGNLSYQNALTAVNEGWLLDGHCDTIFLNYWWGQPEVDSSVTQAKKAGLDLLNSAFFGIEMEGGGWQGQPPVDPTGYWAKATAPVPANGSAPAKASVAMFDAVQDTVRWSRQQAADPSVPAIAAATYDYERRFWSGAAKKSGRTSACGRQLRGREFLRRAVGDRLGSVRDSIRHRPGHGVLSQRRQSWRRTLVPCRHPGLAADLAVVDQAVRWRQRLRADGRLRPHDRIHWRQFGDYLREAGPSERNRGAAV